MSGLRWRLWWWLADRPGICPSSSHSRIVMGVRDASLRIAPICTNYGQDDTCWCGKVQPRDAGASSVPTTEAGQDPASTSQVER